MKEKVLLAGTDDSQAGPLLAELARRGYAVTAVGGGLAALNRARSLLPDLIVLGPTLEALDGLDELLVCELMCCQPSTADIPVVLLTALNRSADPQRCRVSGAVDILDGLTDLDYLVTRLELAMGIRRTRLLRHLGLDSPQDPGAGVDLPAELMPRGESGPSLPGIGLGGRRGAGDRRAGDLGRARQPVT
jgi:CheY-like chemotaxis protein